LPNAFACCLDHENVTNLTSIPALIRYFLYHPLTPRPLRFSRNRYLRHWTIHRAWQLFQAKQRRAHELELERQYQAMQSACEELRVGAGDGGRLFRKSMIKKGIFTDMFPIEYGRMQTEYPAGEGWNHDWKRPERK
jgi:large subunit ribosomal protein L40